MSKTLMEFALILFMFGVCIVITNILLGLTVCRIEYFMKKADITRLENTANECLRWSNWMLVMKSLINKNPNNMLDKEIKITITSMPSNSECSGVLACFSGCYYWITKKFVEAQG